MAAPASRRPSTNWKSLILQVVFAVLLVIIARMLWKRDTPERLRKSPDSEYKILDGKIYMFAAPEMLATFGFIPATPLVSRDTLRQQDSPEQAKLTLQTQSLSQEGIQVLCKDDPNYQPYLPNDFSVVGGRIYYAIEPQQKRADAIGGSGKFAGGAAGVTASAPFAGTFLASSARSVSDPGRSGEQSRRRRVIAPSTIEVRFRQVSTQGGTPQDAVRLPLPVMSPGARPSNVCLIGDHVCWVQAGGEETEQVRRDKGQVFISWKEVTAQSDLMLTSLKDGTTRCIRHGIPHDTTLIVGDSGVAWIQPEAYPKRPTLFYARISDGSVRALGGMAADGRSQVSHFVESGDRVYWTDVAVGQSPNCTLMSAGLDGTGLREVCEMRDKHPIESMLLYSYQSSLYCVVTEAPVVIKEEAVRYQYLCRLRPERADPLEVVRKMPKQSSHYQFDAGYLYFAVSEQEQDLWGKLTADPFGGRQVDTLCRVSLPH